jgi:molybdopterin synthase catalytic subunit
MAEVTSGIVDQPLDVGAAATTVADPSCGGIATFVGSVRISSATRRNSAKEVVALEYEAHPTLAEERLGQICDEAATRWGLAKVVALHRSGRCDLGEPTVVVACSAPHRGEALEACRWLIDELKATVPIWKKEIYADGTAWVGAHP